ncbi:MAG: hypothetical protein HEQ39_09515 [Rhizobacter sp.]
MDGPSVPVAILRLGFGQGIVAGGVCGRGGLFGFELIEQPVEVLPVEDQARALRHGHQLRSPHLVKRSALYADVGHGFLVGEAALVHHAAIPW